MTTTSDTTTRTRATVHRREQPAGGPIWDVMVGDDWAQRLPTREMAREVAAEINRS